MYMYICIYICIYVYVCIHIYIIYIYVFSEYVCLLGCYPAPVIIFAKCHYCYCQF